MHVTDADAIPYLRMFTLLSLEDIAEIERLHTVSIGIRSVSYKAHTRPNLGPAREAPSPKETCG